MSGKDNLVPLTTDKAREIGRKGGIESGKAKRIKRLMSSIYAEILAEDNSLESGLDIKEVVRQILKKGGSPAVSQLREIREATEGSKIKLDADVSFNAEEQREKIKEKLNKIATDRNNQSQS